MQKLVFFLLFTCALFFKAKAQNANEELAYKEVYISLSEKYLSAVNLKVQEQFTESFPFLMELSKNYQILDVKSSFYFSRSKDLNRIIRVSLGAYDNPELFVKEVQMFKEDVKYAELVPIFKLEHTPNDLQPNILSGQWGLYTIQAREAWDLTKGSPQVVVAIVDDAIEISHKDLAPNLVAGWDVADNDGNPSPDFSTFRHGTHVTGIAGAATNNGYGTIASIGYNIKVMPIKSTASIASNAGYITHGYEGLTWAADNGAKVINCSWGSSIGSWTGQAVVDYAYNVRKCIIVASAGNNNNSTLNYPAAYDNVVAVASTDIYNSKSSFSSFGSYVDVAAPGTNIKSTYVGNTYGTLSGTSMASPLVTGLCGLMLSVNPIQLDQTTIINCLKSTTMPSANYVGQLGTGIINAFNAVKCVKSALCKSNYVVTGAWNIPITESNTWIKVVGRTTPLNSESIKLDADPNNGYVEILAASNNDYFISTPTASGVFIAQALDGCQWQLPARVVANGNPNETPTPAESLQVDVNSLDIAVQCYPNPVMDKAIFRLEIPAQSKGEILIFDVTGKRYFQQDLASGNQQIEVDCSEYANGMYFYKILINNELKKTSKFVVQK